MLGLQLYIKVNNSLLLFLALVNDGFTFCMQLIFILVQLLHQAFVLTPHDYFTQRANTLDCYPTGHTYLESHPKMQAKESRPHLSLSPHIVQKCIFNFLPYAVTVLDPCEKLYLPQGNSSHCTTFLYWLTCPCLQPVGCSH